MNKFNIGNKVTSIWEPDKIGTINSIDTMSHPEPKYTIVYPDGNEYTNYGACFKLVVDVDDVLEKGEILVEDEIKERNDNSYMSGHSVVTQISNKYTNIRIIRYESHIYYIKSINDKVVKFKELTRDER